MHTEHPKIARNKRRNSRRKLKLLVTERNWEEARKSVPSYRRVKRLSRRELKKCALTKGFLKKHAPRVAAPKFGK